MSSSPEPENAAPPGTVNERRGPYHVRVDDQDLPSSRRAGPPRAKSASLLTQALATNYEADEPNANSPSASLRTLNPPSPSIPSALQQQNEQFRHMNTREGTKANAEDMAALVASASACDLRPTTFGVVHPSESPSLINFHDMHNVNSLLTSHRDFLNRSKGRGISMERTEQEKRIGDSPTGSLSINPGDTALGRSSPPSPSAGAIASNPPTEGLRATYRSWRDARPGMATEKAWSIGEQGSDESGQVEKSIKDSLAGVGPNSRSRKSSYSVRLFREGLPEEKTKKREKNRGRSKEDSRKDRNDLEFQGRINGDNQASFQKVKDTQSLWQAPGDQFSSPNSFTDDVSPTVEYFDLPTTGNPITQDQLRELPAQLLADIRKHHNLTPGAAKGSSFSRSIPVTASEKSLSDASADSPLTLNSTCEETYFNGKAPSPQGKRSDDDDDSGEEQIASAFFVPHKTPHESPDRSRAGTKQVIRPIVLDQDRSEASTTEQWLEEHEVLSRDVNEKYVSKEVKDLPLPSPVKTSVKTPIKSPITQQEPFSCARDHPKIDHNVHDDEGYSTKGEESGFPDDHDSDTTPTGSLKHGNQASTNFKVLHDHQQQDEPQQPLGAVELIPYRHQVGGHTTLWRFSKRAVCKQLNNRENEFYEKLERYHPQLLKFLPRYIGVLNVNFAKQARRKSIKAFSRDDENHNKQDIGDATAEQSKSGEFSIGSCETTSSNDNPDRPRIVSQSLHSLSIPIPTVTFADNRHIIPKSFLYPNWSFGGLTNGSLSDGKSNLSVNQAQPPLPQGEFTFREKAPSSGTGEEQQSRPTLENKHSDSWGSTIKNKDLRNKVFDEAFLQQPIPIQYHRKPASQRRSLPNRHGSSTLRVSNSESSLKTAQQSHLKGTQPHEESMRKKAMKCATEQRLGVQPMTPLKSTKEDGPQCSDVLGEAEFEEKAGKSAPEPELSRTEDSSKGKRQRRYSSGGLRRKPNEVADDRGNLKYFEEADDAGYKGDAEEDVFAMDPEPRLTLPIIPQDGQADQEPQLNTANGDYNLKNAEVTERIMEGTMLPAAGNKLSTGIEIPRPVNPKQAQTQQGSRVEYFLLLEDLTAGMKRPCIMDLKMGTRQYGVEANETKQKSQRTKCEATTSKELGVRVCGLQVWDVKTQTYVFQDKYFGRDLKVGREFQNALKRFLYDGVDESSILRHIPTILHKLSELEVMIRGLSGYRFYAASLLMFYDGDTTDDGESDSAAGEKDMGIKRKDIDFKMADFANCVVKEDFHRLTRPCPPRHPDLPDKGFLRGLKSLRKYFLAIQEEVRRNELGYSKEETNGSWNLQLDGTDDYDDDGEISY